MTTSPTTVAPSSGIGENPPIGRIEAWTIAAITAAFVSLVALWTVLTPVFDAPDEVIHLNSAIRLTDGWDWPPAGEAQMLSGALAAMGEAGIAADQRSTFGELIESHPGYRGVDQMSQHPPLYYAYAATVLNAIDFMNVRADLALLAVRLAGLIFVVPLPALVWSSVRRITRSPKTAIVGAASLFAIPQMAHIMGSVSNDGMTILFSSIVIWLGIRIMTGDSRWRTVIALGAALTLGLLTKGTAAPLVLFAMIVLALWPTDMAIGRRMARFATAGAITVIGGLWWIRNIVLFGTLQPSADLLPTREWPEGAGPDIIYFLNRVWGGLSSSFWGHFGWLSHPMPTFVTATLTVLSLAVIVFFAFRRSPDLGKIIAIAAVPAIVIAVFLVQRWGGYNRTQLTPGVQGRYFFPLVVSLITLSAVGWRNLIRPEERRTAGSVLLSGFAFVAVLGIVVEYAAVYDGTNWFMFSPIGTIGSLGFFTVAAGLGVTAFIMAWRFIHDAAARGLTPTFEASAD